MRPKDMISHDMSVKSNHSKIRNVILLTFRSLCSKSRRSGQGKSCPDACLKTLLRKVKISALSDRLTKKVLV